MLTLEEVISKLRPRVRELSDRIRFLTVFGSLVKGRVSPLSDLDLGVYPRKGVDELLLVADLLQIVTSALKITEDRVDVVLLNRVTSLPFLFDAVVRGVPLYQDDFYRDFRDRVASLYMDFVVMDPAMIDVVKKGDKVKFTVEEQDGGRFVITDLEVIAAGNVAVQEP